MVDHYKLIKKLLQNSKNLDDIIKNKTYDKTDRNNTTLILYLLKHIRFQQGDEKRDSIRIINRLIDAGCDLEIIDNSSEFVLQTLATLNRKKVKINSKYINIIDPNIMNILDKILNKVNINQQDKLGNTALMYAILRNNIYMIKRLITLGCNINLQNINGMTPLMYAINKYSCEMDIIDYLVKEECDLNIQDNNGKTALMHAINNYSSRIYRLLMQKSELDIKDRNGKTALMYVLIKGIDIKQLVDLKCNINISDNNGDTALMYAIKYHRTKAIQILLDEKCKVGKRNKKGETEPYLMIYHSGQYHKMKKHLKHIIKRGIEIDTNDDYNDAILRCNDIEIMRYLILKTNICISIHKNKKAYHQYTGSRNHNKNFELYPLIKKISCMNLRPTDEDIIHHLIGKGAILYNNMIDDICRKRSHRMTDDFEFNREEIYSKLANVSLFFRCVRHIYTNRIKYSTENLLNLNRDIRRYFKLQ